MLQLKDITKVYGEGETQVHALKGVNLTFPESGIVSILGQSGCGKTTMLNIIGGLDKYTSGELVIDGVSTKDYKNSDWDAYRNHNVGFVFQNYYLIPHLSVLENVMLAMNLSGLSKEEQRKKAVEALKKVGLADQIKKKPKQLSGGQAQRVAIARAIANEPKIVLADEPTGALDSENSVQILELLRALAKDALIIIVTHNSELADLYSDRIIRMKDGLVTSDEIVSEELENEKEVIRAEEVAPVAELEKAKRHKKKRRPTMSVFAAFKTSLKNLYYKKGRTIITVIAGCISIVSISLILALNSGFAKYTDKYQRDSLAKYPIRVNQTQSSLGDIEDIVRKMSGGDFKTLDSAAIMTILKNDKINLDDYDKEDMVRINKLITGLGGNLDDLIKSNDTEELKKYIDENKSKVDSLATIKYDYEVNMNVYTKKSTRSGDTYVKVSPFCDRAYDSIASFNNFLSLIGIPINSKDLERIRNAVSAINFWDEMVDDKQVLDAQYDLLTGHWPEHKDDGTFEVVMVVDSNNCITDASLYALGYIEMEDLLAGLLSGASGNDESVEEVIRRFAGRDFDISVLTQFFKNGLKDIEVDYTFEDFLERDFKLLLPTDYYAFDEGEGNFEDKSKNNEFVQNAVETKGVDIKISGIVRLKDGVPSGCINGDIGYTRELSDYIIAKTAESEVVKQQQAKFALYEETISAPEYTAYIELKAQIAENTKTLETLTEEEQLLLNTYDGLRIESVIEDKELNSEADYEFLMRDLGVKNTDKPNSILFYPKTLESVAEIENFLGEYNRIKEDEYNNRDKSEHTSKKTVEYENELKTAMSSLNQIIDTITYVLIAVTCLAVIVSLFMISIIMYISVQDRTKEIGILRSMGARRLDITNIFNAETALLGFLSGILGIIIGYAIVPLANYILNSYLGISGLISPIWWHSILLVLASVVLTVISGLAPAVLASKKDPVVALRTE